MGAWGPGIFSDDTAMDLRNDYRDLLGDGVEGPAATDRLLASWGPTVDDPGAGPVFWLALAATQWSLGRLEPRVRQRAVQIIDSGAGSAGWRDDAKLLARREAALQRLRAELEQPSPAPKRVARQFVSETPFDVGDVFTYALSPSRKVLMHVHAIHADKGGRSPCVGILDWVGEAAPHPEQIRKLSALTHSGPWRGEGNQPLGWLIAQTASHRTPLERIDVVARNMLLPLPQLRLITFWSCVREGCRLKPGHVDARLHALVG